VLAAAWKALPAGSFTAEAPFDELSRYVIRDHWDLLSSKHWPDAPAEAWRRYLIRLFVAGRVLAGIRLLDDRDVVDLRNVLIQAGLSADVARLMLQDVGVIGREMRNPRSHRRPPPDGRTVLCIARRIGRPRQATHDESRAQRSGPRR
jgi:hypothetical protein